MSLPGEPVAPNYQTLELPRDRIQEAGTLIGALINPHMRASFLHKPDQFLTTVAINLKNDEMIGLSGVTYPSQSNPQHEAVLVYLAVSEQYQDLGIGSKLLELVEQDARQKRMDAITLSADPGSTGFYLKRGYSATGSIEPKQRTPFRKDLTQK
jgi:ribosomal protein S18 acetylase RimI-like enzyme